MTAAAAARPAVASFETLWIPQELSDLQLAIVWLEAYHMLLLIEKQELIRKISNFGKGGSKHNRAP
ncbi:hypothetical protein V2A60_009915 [Cordyceps javanica]